MRWRGLVRRWAAGLLLSIAFGATAAPAQARDLFLGVYDHALFAERRVEPGVDVMVGFRTGPVRRWTWLARPAVHLFLSANTRVPTHFAAVGLDWPLTIAYGGRLYVRPGIGMAYTTGEANIGNSADLTVSPAEHQRRLHLSQTRLDFGSKVLFEPELAFGYKVTRRMAVEVSYVHLSNGQILHRGKNQGLDDVGLRVAYSF